MVWSWLRRRADRPSSPAPPATSRPAAAPVRRAEGGRPEAAADLGLTRRECDVLRLIVEGRTDQEIADALYLSRRTVTSYVTAILGKLGVPSRSAAAAEAVRRGLG